MNRIVGPLLTLLLVILPLSACAPAGAAAPNGDATQESAPEASGGSAPESSEPSTQEPTAAGEAKVSPTEPAATTEDDPMEPNFVLLISDERNDIGDFIELWVTITGLGLVQGDEEGIVEVDIEDISVNLVEVIGDYAVAAWTGYIPEGDYTKVFLYVEEAWGLLADAEEGEETVVTLPSDKLQLRLPIVVEDALEGEEQEPVEFVYDITVHRAGNSGQYILSPQATESGQGKAYRLLQHTEERIMKGTPDFAGERETTGKPDWAGQPGGRETEETEEPE